MTDTSASGGNAAIEPAVTIDTDLNSVPGSVRLHVRGEIDMLTAPRLRDALEEHLATPGTQILVDLEQVSFLGSAGLQLLVESLERARSGDVELALICTARQSLRPLSMTGLDAMFTIYPSTEAVPPRH